MPPNRQAPAGPNLCRQKSGVSRDLQEGGGEANITKTDVEHCVACLKLESCHGKNFAKI